MEALLRAIRLQHEVPSEALVGRPPIPNDARARANGFYVSKDDARRIEKDSSKYPKVSGSAIGLMPLVMGSLTLYRIRPKAKYTASATFLPGLERSFSVKVNGGDDDAVQAFNTIVAALTGKRRA